MSAAQAQVLLLMVRGIVADLPEEEATQIKLMAQALRAAVAANGDRGEIAFALVAAERAVEAEG